MNVLKNCSNKFSIYSLFYIGQRYLITTSLLLISLNIEAADKLAIPAKAIGTTDYLKVLLGLLFVIGLFFISTYLFKRYGHGPMAGRGQLRVIDGLHLGNRERLVLVELNKKQILLAITPGKIKKLDTVDATEFTQTSFEDALEKSKPISENQDLELSNA